MAQLIQQGLMSWTVEFRIPGKKSFPLSTASSLALELTQLHLP
jgi:hypothetical protein